MIIDPESGMSELPREPVMAPSGAAERIDREDRMRRTTALARIEEACQKALRGELPRDCQPRDDMPERLCTVAIQAILDYSHGATILEIAEKYEYNPVYVRTLTRHPDAVTIMSLVLGARADKMMDMASRVEALAPEALTVKVDLMRTSANPVLRDKIATDFLSMSGYGERKKIETSVKHEHSFVVPAQAATGLRAALDESKRIASLDYSKYLARSPGEEEAQAATLQLSDGLTDAGSLPTAPLAERVA